MFATQPNYRVASFVFQNLARAVAQKEEKLGEIRLRMVSKSNNELEQSTPKKIDAKQSFNYFVARLNKRAHITHIIIYSQQQQQ